MPDALAQRRAGRRLQTRASSAKIPLAVPRSVTNLSCLAHMPCRLPCTFVVVALLRQSASESANLAQNTHEYPREWTAMRQGLNERLERVAKEVPAAIRHDPLENAYAAFSAIMEDMEERYGEESGSHLPLAFRSCAEELADAIKTEKFDSLEIALSEEAESYLMAMHPFVQELARIQTSSEWTNYDTQTDHPDGLTLGVIATELLERKESVCLHVSACE